jgi:hypothetical protein
MSYSCFNKKGSRLNTPTLTNLQTFLKKTKEFNLIGYIEDYIIQNHVKKMN